MTEPTELDIVDKILDKLKANLTADLQTAIAVADESRVKYVTIGPLTDDKEDNSPYIELYHAPDDPGIGGYRGGSYPIALQQLIGGGGLWIHMFKIVVGQYMVSGDSTRTKAADRHAALRYRVKKCLMDDPNLGSTQDTFGSTVAANCSNSVIVRYTSETRGGEDDWIWTTTYYVGYRVDQP